MDLQIAGKTALVTGSTAGIGYAIAVALAQEGVAVIVNGRTEERVTKTIASIKESNAQANVTGIAADLSIGEGIQTLTAALPKVDILVNNLGFFEPKAFGDITDDDWMKIFEYNVLSGARLSRTYLPKMIEQNWGRIVFISSESAINIPSEMIHYGVTKTAQVALARGLAETTVGTNVTVNSVLPGPTRSEGVEGFVKSLAQSQGVDEAQVETDFFKTMRPSSLLKRFEDPREIATMVAYVCSALASGTNGAALRVEGGLLRSIV